jgi:VWFA-related protein
MRARSYALILFLCCPASPDFAGQGGGRQISLDVVVTEHSGNPVTGLQEQDFTVLDDKQPQKIVSFRSGGSGDSQLQAMTVIDTINSGFQAIAYQRDELEKFLRQNGSELPLPMSLALLPPPPNSPSETTRDGNVLVNDLESQQWGLRNIRRSQGFYGGVERVQNSLDALNHVLSYEATQPGRKVVIWLGPGWPLLSGPNVLLSGKDQEFLFHTLVRLTTAMQEARVTLYNIYSPADMNGLGRAFYYETFLKGVRSAGQIQNGNLGLQVFAVQSGGQVLNRTNDITGAIGACLEEARTSYTLTFESAPASRPDEYHSLQVKVDRPKVTARTSTGYYAEP